MLIPNYPLLMAHGKHAFMQLWSFRDTHRHTKDLWDQQSEIHTMRNFKRGLFSLQISPHGGYSAG